MLKPKPSEARNLDNLIRVQQKNMADLAIVTIPNPLNHKKMGKSFKTTKAVAKQLKGIFQEGKTPLVIVSIQGMFCISPVVRINDNPTMHELERPMRWLHGVLDTNSIHKAEIIKERFQVENM